MDDPALSKERMEHLLEASEYSKTAEKLIDFYVRNKALVDAAVEYRHVYTTCCRPIAAPRQALMDAIKESEQAAGRL